MLDSVDQKIQRRGLPLELAKALLKLELGCLGEECEEAEDTWMGSTIGVMFVFEVDFDSGEEERLREEVMGEKVFNN